jgi:plasmid stability protein
MGVMVQIRNVPPELHRRLKARAALAGMSLSEYLLRELRELADLPTQEEFLERLARRQPVDLERGLVARLIREGREGRPSRR